MPIITQLDLDNAASTTGIERRRHPRVTLSTRGRFLAPDGSEYPCDIRDISLVGVAVLSDTRVNLNDHIIAYLDEFGRFEGTVARVFEGGFAIETALAGPRRERVAERLDLIARGEPVDPAIRRAYIRLSPQEAGLEEGSVLVFADGTTTGCRIIDMALGGVNVAAAPRPLLGSLVLIGKMKGRVVRHTAEGVAIEFTEMPAHVTALSRPFG